MAGDKKQVQAQDLKIEGSTEQSYVSIEGLRIRLAKPLEFNFEWVGNDKVVNQLRSSWYSTGKNDPPMSPRLVGKPGVGKTVLAYAAAKMLEIPVYFFQATSDTTPNDVLITPVVIETGKDSSRVEYVASSLVTAVLTGGAIVFDEGNRMQEKAWASLAPLLDSRRYVESVTAGVVIKAHPEFRFVSTMNDDASCFDLPEYIQSRLQPQIYIEFPPRDEERQILEANLPVVSPSVLDYVTDFLQNAHQDDQRYSVREGIHIANYASKFQRYEEENGRHVTPGQAVLLAVERVLGVRETRYIKQVIWREEEASA